MIPPYHYKGFEVKWPHPGRFCWSGVADKVVIRSTTFVGIIDAIDEHYVTYEPQRDARGNPMICVAEARRVWRYRK